MNFKNAIFSIHGLVAALLLVVFVGWKFLAGISFGRADGFSNTYLLWTGWLALAIYLFLFLYAVRKNAHRFGYSPEFRQEVSLDVLEEAHRRLGPIKEKIRLRKLSDPKEISAEASAAFQAAGAGKVLRPEVTAQDDESEPFALRGVPREPLRRLSEWFQGHVNYGIAAALLVWFHGGLSFSSPMSILLNGLSLFVLGTGYLGIYLWTTGPKQLTRRERDLSLEKAFALRQHYADKLAEEPSDQDKVILQQQRDRVEQEWKDLNGIRNRMHCWRIIHVPCSIVLMLLVVVHVVTVIYY